MKLICLFFIGLCLSLTTSAQSKANRSLVVEFEKVCQKSFKSFSSRSEKKKLCQCVASKHATQLSNHELKVLIKRYSELGKESKAPIDDSLSILYSFDAEVAEKCMNELL